MEPLEMLRRASEYYDRRLTEIAADQWSMPSICDGWTIKDLADHVLGGNRFAVGLLAGLDAEGAIAGARHGGFDDDPLISYRSSVHAQLDAFGAAGELDFLVHHPAGDLPARQFLGFRLGDLLLHGWDLARSTGGDDMLDEELVPAVWDAYQPILEAVNDRGTFGEGPSGTVSSDSPLSLRLLDLTGRRP